MNHQQDTDMKRYSLKVMLLQSGLYVILGLVTMVVMTFVVSGDSGQVKQENTMLQSIQRK